MMQAAVLVSSSVRVDDVSQLGTCVTETTTAETTPMNDNVAAKVKSCKGHKDTQAYTRNLIRPTLRGRENSVIYIHCREKLQALRLKLYNPKPQWRCIDKFERRRHKCRPSLTNDVKFVSKFTRNSDTVVTNFIVRKRDGQTKEE